MKRKLTATLAMMSLAFFAATAQNADENLSWDIYPDTWVGTDGAGRIQPTQAETGKTKPDKKRDVGMFYRHITEMLRKFSKKTPPHALTAAARTGIITAVTIGASPKWDIFSPPTLT